LAHVPFERIYTKHQLCFLQHERIRKLPPGLLLHRASCLEVRLLSVASPCKFTGYRPILVDLTIKLCVVVQFALCSTMHKRTKNRTSACPVDLRFLTGQIAKKLDCPVKNQTPGNSRCRKNLKLRKKFQICHFDRHTLTNYATTTFLHPLFFFLTGKLHYRH